MIKPLESTLKWNKSELIIKKEGGAKEVEHDT